MRKGATLLFKNGFCYQSYEWKTLRPLGNLQNAINHLDAYKIDEISIIRPVRSSAENLESDLRHIKNLKCSTPLSFGGGIRNYTDLEKLEGLPVERFILSSPLFYKDLTLIKKLYIKYGKQSIIGFVPFFLNNNKISLFNSSKNSLQDIYSLNYEALDYCDEIILFDCMKEGKATGFRDSIIEKLNLPIEKLVCSGGVSTINFKEGFLRQKPKSILIENKVLHKENSKAVVYDKMY